MFASFGRPITTVPAEMDGSNVPRLLVTHRHPCPTTPERCRSSGPRCRFAPSGGTAPAHRGPTTSSPLGRRKETTENRTGN